MPTPVPALDLTHGQVAWALNRGASPQERMLDQLRYLRQLGVPFDKAELGSGRGNRIRYDYDHFIEAGVALFALQRGVKPQAIASFLKDNRPRLRELYHQAFLDQPAGALEAEWVKSRGRIGTLLADEMFLRLHDRYAETSGQIEVLGREHLADLYDFGMLVERYPGDDARTLVPLTRLVLELVAWAQEAPEIKPGR